MKTTISQINPLLVSILLLCLILFSLQSFQTELRFDRERIDAGAWWLLFTGNLVHSNWAHLSMNALGVILLWFLFGQWLNTTWFWIAVIVISIGVGVGLYLLSSRFHWYVGFSGTLYGLYILGGILGIRYGDRLTGFLLLTAIPAKLLWDSFHPPQDDFSTRLIGIPVATDAHWYGVTGGILTGLAHTLYHSIHKATDR